MSFGIPVRNGVGIGLGPYASMSLAGFPSSTLSQTFAGAAALDASITFSRATVASYTNAAGVLTQAASGEARFDYDPVTLAPLGLIIEEARTNLLLNSTINGASLATQNVTTSATASTLTFYGTGTVTLSGTSTAGPLVGSGAYPTRSTLTFTPTAGTLTLTVTGTVSYAQLEAGAFATTWIPTAGATVTRNADNATMTGANFTSWFNATEGTLVVKARAEASNSANRDVADIATDASNRMVVFKANTTGVGQLFISSGGSTQASLTPGSTVWDSPSKMAIAYRASDFAAAINSSVVSTDSAGTVPACSQMTIGRSVSNNEYLNGRIASITYYPSRLSNAQLQALCRA